jgi:hypothetical protein
MIPDFDGNGYLPPGIHAATLDEISHRFGHEPELRRVQMESIRWMVGLARRAQVARIVINGSFVTAKWEPNDVDCVLLLGPSDQPDLQAESDLLDGLPFLTIELVDDEAFRHLTERTFHTDRNSIPKGMIEVVS